MLLNPENKKISIKFNGPSINIIQDDSIIPLENIQMCVPPYENLEHIEILHISLSFSFFDPSEFTAATNKITKILTSFTKLKELYLKVDFNPKYAVLQNLDMIINQLQHLPIKLFSFYHISDLLPNIDYFVKNLALNTNLQLQDIHLALKILNRSKGEEQYFRKIIQNLCILIQKNQIRLRSFNLTLAFLKYEDVYEMDYQLFNTLLECPHLSSLVFQTNIFPNQYLPLPPALNDPQFLHLQNLTELNLEFQSYESSRQALSKQMYLLCQKNLKQLRLVNAIDKLSDLDVGNINPAIQILSFSISSQTHSFDASDFNTLNQLSTLRNLLHLRVIIQQPSTLSNRDFNCMLVAQDLLISLPLLLHFEVKIKGFIDSQNFIRFLNCLREKQYLIRLKQLNTSAGLQQLMFKRRQIIRMINTINQKDYKYRLNKLFRKDIIIDMLKFIMDLAQQQ